MPSIHNSSQPIQQKSLSNRRYHTCVLFFYPLSPLLSSYLVSDFSFSSLSSGLFSLESSKKSTLLSRLYRIVFLSHLLPVPLFCTFWNNNNNSPGMRRLYRLFSLPLWYSFSFFCFCNPKKRLVYFKKGTLSHFLCFFVSFTLSSAQLKSAQLSSAQQLSSCELCVWKARMEGREMGRHLGCMYVCI